MQYYAIYKKHNSFSQFPVLTDKKKRPKQIELEEDWGLKLKLLLLTFQHQKNFIDICWIWFLFYIHGLD